MQLQVLAVAAELARHVPHAPERRRPERELVSECLADEFRPLQAVVDLFEVAENPLARLRDDALAIVVPDFTVVRVGLQWDCNGMAMDVLRRSLCLCGRVRA